MYPDGADLRQLTTDPGGASSELPAFSPNAKWLTYTHILASGASSIWKLDVSGADQSALTTGPKTSTQTGVPGTEAEARRTRCPRPLVWDTGAQLGQEA